MAIALPALKLEDIAPDSITPDKQSADCMTALDPELRAQWPEVATPAVLHRLGSLTSRQLDHVARWFDAPSWNTSWGEAQKRQVIRQTIEIKRHMGTLAAVRAALATVNARCVVTEWWQEDPPGTPHTFRVSVILSGVDDEMISEEKQAEVIRLIWAAKPVRSHFTFELLTAVQGGKGSEAVLRTMAAARLRND